MAHRAINIPPFHRVESIYILVSLVLLCIVNRVNEAASFLESRSINGRGT